MFTQSDQQLFESPGTIPCSAPLSETADQNTASETPSGDLVFYDPSTNMVVYETAAVNPQRGTLGFDKVLSCTTGSKILSASLVAVPATLTNLQAMQKLQMPTIGPLNINYDWPLKPNWKPLPHQKITSNHMVLHPRSFVFNEMGTMKTLSALWAADFVMQEERNNGQACRCLIVAPLSILQIVWAQAIFSHFMGRRTSVVLHGSAEKRRKLLERDVDFYIINHDGLGIGVPADRKSPLTGLAADLEKRTDIQIVIIDEASAYRAANTRRHKAGRILLGGRPYLWLLTGTPTPNGPFDAHGLARLMGLTTEPAKIFKQRVMVQLDKWKWVPRAGASETVRKLLQPAIRFNSDFLALPPCTPEQREVPFSKEQAAAYKDLKTFALWLKETGEIVKAENQAALRTKLIQVAAGVVYGPPDATGHKPSYLLEPRARLDEVRSIIEETERKVIIYAPLTSVLIMLYEELKDWLNGDSQRNPNDFRKTISGVHGETGVEIVNGEVSLAKRGDIFGRFGSPQDKLRVLLLDPATVSHGINELVTASVAIWYCPTDKPEHYQQGNKRIHRPGQIGPTKIIQLVSTSIEKEIYSRLEKCDDMQGVVLKLVEDGK